MDGNRYGEIDKSLVTKQESALFNERELRILSHVKEHTGVAIEKLTRHTQMHGPEIQCDSLDVVEIVMAIEDDFHIEIADSEADAVATIADLFALVDRKLS